MLCVLISLAPAWWDPGPKYHMVAGCMVMVCAHTSMMVFDAQAEVQSYSHTAVFQVNVQSCSNVFEKDLTVQLLGAFVCCNLS